MKKKLICLIFVPAFLLFNLYSCDIGLSEDDPCAIQFCLPTGTCVEGICICDEGYEGELCECETGPVTNFLGRWSTDDWNCLREADDGSLGLQIEKSQLGDSIIWRFDELNGGSMDENFFAYSSGDSLIIPPQRPSVSGDSSFFYFGYFVLLSEDSIRFNLQLDNTMIFVNCERTLFRS